MTQGQVSQIHDARLLIRWAANQLSERERSVLALVMEGHNDQDIGELLGFSRENASQVRQRACRKMRERLQRAGYNKSEDLLDRDVPEAAVQPRYGPHPPMA